MRIAEIEIDKRRVVLEFGDHVRDSERSALIVAGLARIEVKAIRCEPQPGKEQEQ